MDVVSDFYDKFATSYHLMGANWDEIVVQQGEVLDRLIQSELHQGPPLNVYDCSCGIGTQSIGLALRGYQVLGTDLSSQAVLRAREEAQKKQVSLQLDVADFRHLENIKGTFDVVISCDNALPHLFTESDMALALKGIVNKLKKGGLSIFSTRDYDQILKDKPQGILPLTFQEESGGRRIYFQTWDWQPNTPLYTFNVFILRYDGQEWKVRNFSSQYRAWTRAEFNVLMKEAGFSNIRWLNPEESGFFQPIVMARA